MCDHCAILVLPMSLMALIADGQVLGVLINRFAFPPSPNSTLPSFRPFVLRRKSWLFANSVAGANASANLYSLA